MRMKSEQEKEKMAAVMQSGHVERLKQIQDDHQKELRRVTDYWQSEIIQTRQNCLSEHEQATSQLKSHINFLENNLIQLKTEQENYQKTLKSEFEMEKNEWKSQQMRIFDMELENERGKLRVESEKRVKIEVENAIKRLAEEQAVLISRYEGEIRALKGETESPRETSRGKRPKVPKMELETPTLGRKKK